MKPVSQRRRRLLKAMAASALCAPMQGLATSCLSPREPIPTISSGFTHWPVSCAVGWIHSRDFAYTGTCFLIADTWIATAAHVLEDARQAETRRVVFNYVGDGSPDDRDIHGLLPYDDGYLRSSPDSDLDYALVRVKLNDLTAAPGKYWGSIPLHGALAPALKEPVLLIHHPDRRIAGNEQKAEHFKCASTSYVMEPGSPDHKHAACAVEGSSGAPLIGLDGRLVGIHSRQHLDETGIQLPGCWVATSAMAILESLRSRTLTAEQAALIRRA